MDPVRKGRGRAHMLNLLKLIRPTNPVQLSDGEHANPSSRAKPKSRRMESLFLSSQGSSYPMGECYKEPCSQYQFKLVEGSSRCDRLRHTA